MTMFEVSQLVSNNRVHFAPVQISKQRVRQDDVIAAAGHCVYRFHLVFRQDVDLFQLYAAPLGQLEYAVTQLSNLDRIRRQIHEAFLERADD